VAPAEHSTERILIVLLGAIGDVVRAMPLAMRLRRGFPRARIAWAVEPPAAPLLERHPAIDERLIFRRDRASSLNPHAPASTLAGAGLSNAAARG
jgi:ADP-heptose:LPS heptosyltransferase